MKKLFSVIMAVIIAVSVCAASFALEASDSADGKASSEAGMNENAGKAPARPDDVLDLKALQEHFGLEEIDEKALEKLLSKAEAIMNGEEAGQSDELAKLNRFARAVLDEETYEDFLDRLHTAFDIFISGKHKNIDQDQRLLAFMDLFDDDILIDYDTVIELADIRGDSDKEETEYIELLLDLMFIDYYDNDYYKDVYQLLKCIKAYDDKHGLQGVLFDEATDILESFKNDMIENSAAVTAENSGSSDSIGKGSDN